MSGVFRAFQTAARLLLSWDWGELCRRLRVRIIGNWSATPPVLPLDVSLPCAVAGGLQDVDSTDTVINAAQRPIGSIHALMFAHNLNYEGAPISQFELTKALMESKCIVPEVVSFNDGPLRSAYEADGITVTVIPSYLDRIPTIARLDKVVGELSAIIRDRKPKIVYANTLLTFAAIMAAHKAGIPSIWNPRESEPWDTYFGFLSKPVAQQALAALTLPYRVVFVAEASRQAWSRFDVRRNFTVICNSLDIRSQGVMPSLENRAKARKDRGYGDDMVVFLCVGTICERKGQRDMVQAFKALPDPIAAHARLCFVGNEQAGYGKHVRSDIDRLSELRRSNVRLCPATSKVWDYYVAADVFVLCSRVESYPRVILEAMAYGLPIITTPVFGVLEQVSKNGNALLYEPGDVSQLANSMRLLLENKQMRQQLAAGSLRQLKNLGTFEEMVDAYANVFQEARVEEAG